MRKKQTKMNDHFCADIREEIHSRRDDNDKYKNRPEGVGGCCFYTTGADSRRDPLVLATSGEQGYHCKKGGCSYYEAFHHVAYINHVKSVKEKEKQRRTRSTSPSLPAISYLRKLENDRRNAQLRNRTIWRREGNQERQIVIAKKPEPHRKPPEVVQGPDGGLMKGFLGNFNFNWHLLGGIIEPEKTPSTCGTERSLQKSLAIDNGAGSGHKRSKSVPLLKKMSATRGQNPRLVELFNPDLELNGRPSTPPKIHRKTCHNRSLIHSIKQMVFSEDKPQQKVVEQLEKEEEADEDEWEDQHMKFPKETRNAMAALLGKKRDRSRTAGPSAAKLNIQTQTSPAPSETAMVIKCQETEPLLGSPSKKIPCPKNLLCERGLHAGLCEVSPSKKGEDKNAEAWPGRAFRLRQVIPPEEQEDLEVDVVKKVSDAVGSTTGAATKHATVTVMDAIEQPPRRTVKATIELLEPLLKGSSSTCKRESPRERRRPKPRR